ncbi:MAG TPA: sulfite exporter TauE/SafE family protein [Stellaceae bacterium]|nr:sulfite exporter TauE/SafE family protein [Stellaceae bacterium]
MLTHALFALRAADIATLAAVLLFSGTVKGLLGIGLPLIAVPLLSQFVELPAAVAVMTVPMAASNVGQAFEGGRTIAAVKALWPIMAAVIVGTVIGVHLLISIDRRRLDVVIGVSFILLAAALLCLPRVRIRRGTEVWAGPLVGLAAGVLGGMSAMFGPPLVAYLVGLGLDPDSFVKRIAILVFGANMALLLALGGSGSMSLSDFLISAAAVVPIQIGMPLGRRLRRWVPPTIFRGAVLVFLALAGLGMLRRGLF